MRHRGGLAAARRACPPRPPPPPAPATPPRGGDAQRLALLLQVRRHQDGRAVPQQLAAGRQRLGEERHLVAARRVGQPHPGHLAAGPRRALLAADHAAGQLHAGDARRRGAPPAARSRPRRSASAAPHTCPADARSGGSRSPPPRSPAAPASASRARPAGGSAAAPRRRTGRSARSPSAPHPPGPGAAPGRRRRRAAPGSASSASHAPARTRFSICILFSCRGSTRLARSVASWNGRPPRAATRDRIAASPTFLTAASA